jgi:hypothetical protein
MTITHRLWSIVFKDTYNKCLDEEYKLKYRADDVAKRYSKNIPANNHEFQSANNSRNAADYSLQYISGGKYCGRCEYYFFTERLFCECCGMRLRSSPKAKFYKEKVRAKRKLVPVI